MFFRAALLRYRPGWWLSPNGRVVIDRLGRFSSRAYGGDRITNGGTDRSFITGIHKRPRSQNVLKAIESLSSALGMTVVVEGIETFEELAYLQAATRIRYVQGFYFSKPIFIGKGGYGDDSALQERTFAAAREMTGICGAALGARYASRS